MSNENNQDSVEEQSEAPLGQQKDQENESQTDETQVSSEQEGQEEQVESEEAQVESIDSLKEALSQAQAQVKEEGLRAQAEIQNIRRRAERDIESAHKFGQEKLIKEMLAVVDSLEMGLKTVGEQEAALEGVAKTVVEGSELTLKLLIDTLAKFNVKQIDPEGEPFDPQFHEAISMIDNPDAEPNSVIAVVQKGFTLNERLVRPAMVVVSKGS